MIGVLIILFGLCVGSFVHAWASRFGTKSSVWFGRSQCPQCNHKLTWFEIVPVFSWVWLRNRCRYCQQTIGWEPVVVEVGFAAGLWWLYGLFGLTWSFWGLACLGVIGAVLALVDYRTQTVPDSLVVATLVVAAIWQWGNQAAVFNLLGAVVVGVGFFLWQYVLSRGQWVGAGDIGLGAVMGLVLGWPYILIALTIAYVIGAVVGVGLVIFKQAQHATALPLAPFLLGATMLTVVYGASIQAWLRQLM